MVDELEQDGAPEYIIARLDHRGIKQIDSAAFEPPFEIISFENLPLTLSLEGLDVASEDYV